MTTRYIEFVIDGPKGWHLGFVRGFLHGRRLGGRVINAEREEFDCEPLREQLRQLLTPDSDTAHILVPEDLVPEVEEATRASEEAGYPLTIRHRRPIEGASFRFSVHAYSREHGKRIKALFENPGAGVRVSFDEPFQESVDPDSVGVELYAPSHDYELTGKGTVEGDLDAVLALYRACREEELVRQDKAELLPG